MNSTFVDMNMIYLCYALKLTLFIAVPQLFPTRGPVTIDWRGCPKRVMVLPNERLRLRSCNTFQNHKCNPQRPRFQGLIFSDFMKI